jgi:hypothetical protein
MQELKNLPAIFLSVQLCSTKKQREEVCGKDNAKPTIEQV